MGTHPIFESDFDCLTDQKMSDAKARFAALKRKRLQAQTANHRDVVEEEAKSRLVAAVNEQIAKRKNFHRRRIHDEDKDITYINERNRKFNEKIDRSYSKYTQEIKQNLERGTAI